MEPQMTWRGGMLDINASIRFEPTPRMREALESGVELQLEVVTRVSRQRGPIALVESQRRHPLTIRFLPLTEQWQLEIKQQQRNFPRLWLLLDALEEDRKYATGLTRELARRGAWQIQARTRFNREALPAPMHLPSLFSPQWRLTGAWHTWQFEAS
jgi:hypothetical protein